MAYVFVIAASILATAYGSPKAAPIYSAAPANSAPKPAYKPAHGQESYNAPAPHNFDDSVNDPHTYNVKSQSEYADVYEATSYPATDYSAWFHSTPVYETLSYPAPNYSAGFHSTPVHEAPSYSLPDYHAAYSPTPDHKAPPSYSATAYSLPIPRPSANT